MSRLDALLRDELERAYPPAELDLDAGWNEVLLRAQGNAGAPHLAARRPIALRSWRTLLPRNKTSFALAFALLVLLCGTALAASAGLLGAPLSGFRHWLGVGPGAPASPGMQRAFSKENASSVARFPRGTTLRLLMRRDIAGTSYQLFGFSAEGSLCLELRRNGAGSAPACAPVSELASGRQPAHMLVAGERVDGNARSAATVSYGLATDSVASVDVVDGAGRHKAALKDNAFVFVSPSGREPLGVIAIDGGGDEVPIAISAGSSANALRGTPLPFQTVPQRVGEGTPSHGTIGWLLERKSFGTPLPHDAVASLLPRGAKIIFARAIAPLAHSSLRVGVILVTSARKRYVCEILYAPLTSSLAGCDAARSLFAAHHLVGRLLASVPSGQRYVLVGLASPEVGSLTYLHAGMDMFKRAPISHGVFAIPLPVSSSSLSLQAASVRRVHGGRDTVLEELESTQWRAPQPR